MSDTPDPDVSPQEEHHGPGSRLEASSRPARAETGLASRGLDRVGLILAWLIIGIGVVLWSIKPGGGEGVDPVAQVPDGLLIDAQTEMSGRISLGMSSLFPFISARSQLAPLSQGSPADQICLAIFDGATSSPEEGAASLQGIVDAHPDDPIVELLAPPVFSAFEAVSDGGLPSEETSGLLEERLGWYGGLAAAMGDPDRLQVIERDCAGFAMTLVTFLLGFGIAGFLGFVGLVVIIFLGCGNPSLIRVPTPARHVVYAETFAGWLLLMLLLQFVMSLVAPAGLGVLMSILAFFGSLLALGWPVLRGIPWSTVRADIGLRTVRFSDVPTGVASWAMALPLMGIGLAITLVLMLLQTVLAGEAASPGHPAQEAAVGAGTVQLVQLFILACVAAPIVEEIMFRGVFLTHLCGWSRKWPLLLGLTFAMAVSSIVFAAIHPQGPIFIPPLAGLAVGFCISRLWRGSLWPAIVAHGVNNAAVLTLNVMLFSS